MSLANLINKTKVALANITEFDGSNRDTATKLTKTYMEDNVHQYLVDITSTLQSERINVIDYGAVGDGVVDDSASIQAAIDSFSGGNGTVFFPASSSGYSLGGNTLELPSNIHLLGVGFNSRLLQTTDVDHIHVTNKNRITIEGLYFLGNDGSPAETDVRCINIGGATAGEQNYTVTDAQGGDFITIKDCYFEKSEIGVAIYGGEGLRIVNCEFNDLSVNAVRIHKGTPDVFNLRHIVSGNHIHDCDAQGIHLHSASSNREIRDCIISNNTIENCGQHGITIQGGDGLAGDVFVRGCSIVGNTIVDSGTGSNFAGILLRDKITNCVVSSNSIRGGELGIYIYSAGGSTILNNPSENVIQGNVIANAAVTGLWVNDARNNKITNNYISRSLGTGENGSGIMLTSAHYSSIQGNTCFNNNNHGIRNIGSNQCNLVGNLCYGNSNAVANVDSGIRMQNSASRCTLVGNVCFDFSVGQKYGIEILSGCADNIITGCVMYQNQTADFSDAGTGTVVANNNLVQTLALRGALSVVGNVSLGGNMLIGTNYIEGDEITDPPAPVANKGVIYFRDNTGKTELVCRFPTGAIQQIAIEP